MSVINFLNSSLAGEISLDDQVEYLLNADLNADDLAEVVRFLECKMEKTVDLKGDFVDICGTGGSNLPRINTSTISAFILAACGLKVAKHGNRAASGRFGSFDLLEALDVDFNFNEYAFRETGLTFLYARNYHKVMSCFAEARKVVGQKYKKATFFNLIGPFLNPLKAGRQVIGTAYKDKMPLLADLAVKLDRDLVFVSGSDGLDEVTLTGETFISEVKDGKTHNYKITPEDFGLKACNFDEIAGGTPELNTKIAKDILSNSCKTKHLDLVLINSAFSLKYFGVCSSFEEAFKKAKKCILDKLAYQKYLDYKKLNALPGILKNIVETKNKEFSRREIETAKPFIIAEIKPKSPTEGNMLAPKISIQDLAQLYLENSRQLNIRFISVLTDNKFFGGSFENLSKAKEVVGDKVKVLAKDFFISCEQIDKAKSQGADAILLIAAILSADQFRQLYKYAKSQNLEVLVELHNQEDLDFLINSKISPDLIGVNSRDLTDFSINLDAAKTLIEKVKKHFPAAQVIAESGLKNRDDLASFSNVDGFLIGTSIVDKTKFGLKATELKLTSLKRPLLKVCGVRGNGKMTDLNCDLIGLNFVETSKRHISLDQAQQILKKLPAKPAKVGVFQNQAIDFVNSYVQELDLDFIQLSGDENYPYVRSCKRPVIKTIKLRTIQDLKMAEILQDHVAFFIFDGSCPGSGQEIQNFKELEDALKKFKGQFFLAGGVNIENLEQFLAVENCLGVDLASGVETAGEFDPLKVNKIFSKLKKYEI
jgi:anthranilate phosphoribosyltransferase